jgi:predicted small secreted protein
MNSARKLGATALLAACLMGLLAGCSTVSGFGKDMQAIGARISGEEPPTAR